MFVSIDLLTGVGLGDFDDSFFFKTDACRVVNLKFGFFFVKFLNLI